MLYIIPNRSIGARGVYPTDLSWGCFMIGFTSGFSRRIQTSRSTEPNIAQATPRCEADSRGHRLWMWDAAGNQAATMASMAHNAVLVWLRICIYRLLQRKRETTKPATHTAVCSRYDQCFLADQEHLWVVGKRSEKKSP